MAKSKSLKSAKFSRENFGTPKAPQRLFEDLNDKEKYLLVAEEIKKFDALIRGHRKILEAIGRL